MLIRGAPCGSNYISSGPIFCLLLEVSSDDAQPITDQVIAVTWPVTGQAQPELTPSKTQNTCPEHWRANALTIARASALTVFSDPQPDHRNLVKNKATLQLDTAAPYVSQYAVDGNYEASLALGSCAKVRRHYYPWWSVDLERSYKVTSVLILPQVSTSKCLLKTYSI